MIETMLRPLEHRGPDGRGVWSAPGVGLGHLRLSILDLTENAHQPMLLRGATAALVYNGEVYNYRDIRQDLQREGVVFTSSGDTEVVLKALAAWGPAHAIPRFNGMFSLAFYDRNNHTIWFTRDRLGIKPLYVKLQDGFVIFGSEPKAVLAHPGVAKEVDRLAMAGFILRGRPDPRQTLFEGIEAVEPGWLWSVDRHQIQRTQWYHALEALDVDRILADQPNDAPTRLETALDESVALHLASDVPLATICSGGVDSSLITALAKRHQPDITAYVVDVPFEHGEGDIAQRAATHLGIPITRVPVSHEQYLRLWPEAVSFEGHPCFHRSNVALLGLVRRCRADGIKVLLNGEGADELFGGYLWHAGAYHANTLTTRVARALVPPRFRRRLEARIRRGRFTPLEGIEGTNCRAAATVDGDGEARRNAIAAKLTPIASRADRALLARSVDDLYYSLDTLLRRHDRMAMASSVEMRVPFIENSVIDLGVHLSRRAKYRDGRGKWVVKKVAERYLPKDIVHARKRAFPMPPQFDAGSEVLLQRGATRDLMRWSSSTTEYVTDACRRDPTLRFLLVGFELWSQLEFGGRTIDDLGTQLLSLSGKKTAHSV